MQWKCGEPTQVGQLGNDKNIQRQSVKNEIFESLRISNGRSIADFRVTAGTPFYS